MFKFICDVCQQEVEPEDLDVEYLRQHNNARHDFCVRAFSIILAKPDDVPEYETKTVANEEDVIMDNVIGTVPSGVKGCIHQE
jgi:hypothetical protein